MNRENAHKDLVNLVTEIHMNEPLRVRPMRDSYVIRVLPKEQETRGGIILPEKQNKTVYEGIVLTAFEPYVKTHWDRDGKEIKVQVEPEVPVGSHVLFPHYAGAPHPVDDWTGKDYRIIKEHDLIGFYSYDADEVKNELRHIVAKVRADLPSSIEAVQTLLDTFVIISKGKRTRTTSGV